MKKPISEIRNGKMRDLPKHIGWVIIGAMGLCMKSRREKFALYAETGVREYWIVDPKVGSIEVYALRGAEYELLGRWGAGEVAHSEILQGFSVAVDEVVNVVHNA